MELDSVIFYTNTLSKSIAFYQEVLELDLEYQQGDKYASFLLANGVRLGIKLADAEREVVGAQTIILSVDDVQSNYEKFQKSDVRFYKELQEYDWGVTFSLLDIDGNKVEFLQRT